MNIIMEHPITKVSKRARQLGYAVAVRKGKLQFQVVTYQPSGKSLIQRITDWLTADEATLLLDEAGV